MCEPSPTIMVMQATEMTEALYLACQRLVPQLTKNTAPPTHEMLALMFIEPTSLLFLAKHIDFGDEIVGLATLVLYRVLTGMRGYIEDVVVDSRARRRHIGEALMQACLDRAKQAGAPQVMLTSNNSRKAANSLYLHMDFKLRKTNVYHYSFLP